MIYESAEFKTQTTTKTIAECKNKIIQKVKKYYKNYCEDYL